MPPAEPPVLQSPAAQQQTCKRYEKIRTVGAKSVHATRQGHDGRNLRTSTGLKWVEVHYEHGFASGFGDDHDLDPFFTPCEA